MRFKMVLAVAASVLALAVACGGDAEKAPSQSPEPSPVTGNGSAAPNVFMTFEDQRYRANNAGSDLVSADEVKVIGATDDIDIDHAGPVEVYRLRDGSADRLYTFQPGRSLPEEEGGSIPAGWLEWVPVEPEASEDRTTEPGDIGGSEPGGEPGTTPVEPAPPPPGPGPTLPPDTVVSATPVPDTGPTPDQSAPVEAARAHLAQRLGVEVEAVKVVSVEAVDWPDGCLGAAAPDEACILIMIPGYRVTLAVDDTLYVYHTGTTGTGVRPAP